jgi:hypothetical protein
MKNWNSRSFFVLLALFASLIFAGVGSGLSFAEDPPARFDADEALLLPEDYRTWVYVGGSVTPNDMNNGKAAFPGFHNVYMDRQSFEAYKNTGTFQDGTVFIKETIEVAGKEGESGKGYFMGEFNGLFAGVKDSDRFAGEPGNWAFFTFKTGPTEPVREKAKAHATESCNTCHQAGAEEWVFIQFYPVLKEAKPE